MSTPSSSLTTNNDIDERTGLIIDIKSSPEPSHVPSSSSRRGVGVGIAQTIICFAATCMMIAGARSAHDGDNIRMVSSLGSGMNAAHGWLNVHRDRVNDDGFEDNGVASSSIIETRVEGFDDKVLSSADPRLAIEDASLGENRAGGEWAMSSMASVGAFDVAPDGFDPARWLEQPRPVFEISPEVKVAALGVEDSQAKWSLVVERKLDLWKIPVSKHGGTYRVGNVIRRRGADWVKARLEMLKNEARFSDSLVGEFLNARLEGDRAFTAIIAANERDNNVLAHSALGPLLDRAVITPIRLSDKVSFLERNEKLIVDAALSYRRSRCPTTCDKFVVSVSLVWGDAADGSFAYDEHEYEESIRALRSMITYAEQVFPADFKMSIVVVGDVDEVVTALAYAPHLMSNPVDSASTLLEVVQSANALLRSHEDGLLRFYDESIAPRLANSAQDRVSEIETLEHIERFVEGTTPDILPPDWFNVYRQIEHWADDVPNTAFIDVDVDAARDLFSKRAAEARQRRAVVKPKIVVLSHEE